jgi:hypothetical protein
VSKRDCGGEQASRQGDRGGRFWLDGQISPSFLFFWGLVLAPAVVLQEHLWLKAAQALAFAAVALAGGRVRFPGSLLGSLAFVGVTLGVNLLSPTGQVLLQLGPFPVTTGALTSGLRKGLTVVALAYLSRLCVRQDLSLPGAAGRYLRQTFVYLNALLAGKSRLRGGELIGRIDRTLEALWRQQPTKGSRAGGTAHTTAAGFALMAAAAGLMWFSAVYPI